MKKNYAQEIIEKIKQEKIVPESKFILNWKSYLFWFIWIFTLFLGAVFFSFIILNLLDINPRVIHQLGLGKIFFILARTAPYLWIILASLTVGSGFMAIRKTKRGYRYSIIFITSIGVLIISVLGAFIHIAKINKHLGDGRMFDRPMSRGIAFPVEKRWQNPADGLLGGEIVRIGEDTFDLKSFNNEIWEVHYSNETEFKIRKMEENMAVAVIGEKIGTNKLKAFLVLPPPFDKRPPLR